MGSELHASTSASAFRSCLLLFMRLLLRSLLALLLLGGPLALTACAAQKAPQAIGCQAPGQAPCLKGSALVSLETSRGEVQLRLDGDAAPLTAGNFLDLIRRGVYNGTAFHRVVRDPVPFVVQGGDPTSADPRVPATAYGQGSFVDPTSGKPRMLPLELKLQQESEPRYGDVLASPGQLRQLQLSHERGALAMARSQDPNSASARSTSHCRRCLSWMAVMPCSGGWSRAWRSSTVSSREIGSSRPRCLRKGFLPRSSPDPSQNSP